MEPEFISQQTEAILVASFAITVTSFKEVFMVFLFGTEILVFGLLEHLPNIRTSDQTF